MTLTTQLPDAASIGSATLSVKNLDRSIAFYQKVIGLKPLLVSDDAAFMGVNDPFLILVEKPNAAPQSPRSTGLYHIAILLPTRKDLARLIRHIAVTKYPLEGYADHRVSEAFYLADPDGHGLELYRDRPRAEWRMNGDQLEMGNDPIDLGEFFSEVEDDQTPYIGAPDGTRIGHMHLKVGDAAQAVDFYTRVIGFTTMQLWHGAGFVAAGGYHHHLGLNHWNSRGGSAPPETCTRLESWMIRVPTLADVDAAAARCEAAGIQVRRQDGAAYTSDPWGTEVCIDT